jgi:DNA modification methylase
MADIAWRNQLYCADNLDVLRKLASESVDLVYLDPPFNSSRSYYLAGEVAFDDCWRWTPRSEERYQRCVAAGGPEAGLLRAFRSLLGDSDATAYLTDMTPRLAELHRVLAPAGSAYLHCDPTMSHYLKVIMDAIFGQVNFRNEIVWKRAVTVKGNFGQGSRSHGSQTDTILYYSKSASYAFRQQFRPYSPAYIDTAYRHVEEGTGRRYRLVSMIGPGGAAKGNPCYEVMGVSRYWRYSRERMAGLISAGLVVQSRPGSVPHRKYYLDEGRGVPVQSLWDDIAALQAGSAESLGYPTQKPAALAERIIATSSDPGDLVLDPFCGSGTTLDAAQRLDRRWIGIDSSAAAIDVASRRLRDREGEPAEPTYLVR